MYQERWLPLPCDGINTAETVPSDPTLDREKTFKVGVNMFRLNFKESIHQYRYDIPDPKTSPEDERLLLEKGWAELKGNLPNFVILFPGRIFSPTRVHDFKISVNDDHAGKNVDMQVRYVATITADQINAGSMGSSSVVLQHIANQLAAPVRIQRVGKRFYKSDCQVKGHHEVISGFCVIPTLCRAGPLLQVDVMHKPASSKSVVEVLKASMEGTDIFQQMKEIKAEWLRFCVSSTVVTSYNFRVYRIKQVRFDMTPLTTFKMYQKDNKEFAEITFVQYLQMFYDKSVAFKQQPLLEAYPEKASEQVFLLPEFCCPTGVTDDMRREKNPLSEVLKQIKASAQERYNAVKNHALEMQSQDKAEEAQRAWGCTLEQSPLEVQARQLEPLQVAYTEKKIFPIDEGSFARSLRNGLQCPANLDNWLLFYPPTDEPVLDIWVRSLKEVAKVAFGMRVAEPEKVCCPADADLGGIIEKHMDPNRQLMMLLIPNKDVRKQYHIFKDLACDRYACISQVVRSDTIRKRQSVGSILHKVVHQINAKFCGPLWHIVPKEPEDTLLQDFKAKPFMVFGIDVFLTFDGARWLGISGTLDKVFSQYYSMAAKLESGSLEVWRASLSLELQGLFRDAFQAFVDCNDGILPQTIVVYRASVNEEDWPLVEAVEVKALQKVLELAAKCSESYSPTITFIAIARKAHMRIFNPQPDWENIKNPEPGTVVDDPAICGGLVPSFYLISQAIVKGSAIPAHFSVLVNSAKLPLQLIENLTNRLCLMYYNVPHAVRVPAPVLYATKIAFFCGTVIKKPPKPRLERTLFFL